MLRIPKEKILERWDNLSVPIREVLTSETTAQSIQDICETQFIPREKIPLISGSTTDVLMGFLHPADLPAEIQKSTGIDARIAGAIATAINQRIFAPIQSEIDKAYQPIKAAPTGPTIVQEIRTAVPAPATVGAAPKMIVTTMQAVPQPQSPRPTATIIPTVPDIRATQKVSSILPTKIGSVPMSTAVHFPATQAPMPPKPLIFETNSSSTPVRHAPDFKMPDVAQNIMGAKTSGTATLRPAIVEFAGTPGGKNPVPVPPPSPLKRTGDNDVPKPEPARTITEITENASGGITPSAPKPPASAFTPISQIPVPTRATTIPGNASIAVTPTPPKPPTAPVPLPAKSKPSIPPTFEVPKSVPVPPPQKSSTANKPEKIIQKDYSETEK